MGELLEMKLDRRILLNVNELVEDVHSHIECGDLILLLINQQAEIIL